jgi:hypothetical protein
MIWILRTLSTLLVSVVLVACTGGDDQSSEQTVSGPSVSVTCARLTGPVTINNTTTVNCPTTTDSNNTTTPPPPPTTEAAK